MAAVRSQFRSPSAPAARGLARSSASPITPDQATALLASAGASRFRQSRVRRTRGFLAILTVRSQTFSSSRRRRSRAHSRFRWDSELFAHPADGAPALRQRNGWQDGWNGCVIQTPSRVDPASGLASQPAGGRCGFRFCSGHAQRPKLRPPRDAESVRARATPPTKSPGRAPITAPGYRMPGPGSSPALARFATARGSSPDYSLRFPGL
jgi:hypothetical protein